MKKLFAATLIGLFLLAPIFATAADFVGSIQGFMCVTQGKVCPIGKEDPVAAAESVFVLLVDAAKGEYYFLPNVDRDILVRHINEQVKITGTMDKKYKSIKANFVYAMKGKTQTKVWAMDKNDAIYSDIYERETGAITK